MQTLYPTQQFQNDATSGTSPGATQGPADGQDNVQASTVNIPLQDLTSSVAYLAALLLGTQRAPPLAQPPGLDLFSGPRRKQNVFTVFDLPFLNGCNGDICNCTTEVGSGEFVYISPLNVPSWTASTPYAAQAIVFWQNAIWMTVLGGTSGNAAPTSFGVGVWNDKGTASTAVTWVALTSGTDSNVCLHTQPASGWSAVAYSAGNYVTDHGNLWLCTVPGTLTSSSAFPTSPTPTPGVTTYIDANGSSWQCVGAYGAWVHSNAQLMGLSATGMIASTQYPQPDGIASTDSTAAVPMGELPLTPTVWTAGAIYFTGQRVLVYVGGSLPRYEEYVCIFNSAGGAAGTQPSGQGTWIPDPTVSTGTLFWNWTQTISPSALPPALAYTVNDKVPIAQLPVDIASGIAGLDTHTYLTFRTGTSVAAGATVAPTMLNSWTAGQGLAYWKDQCGIVHVKGTVNNGTSTNLSIFNLPAGYRPSNSIHQRAFMTAQGVPVYVCGDNTLANPGDVIMPSGATTHDDYYLDCISFLAEA